MNVRRVFTAPTQRKQQISSGLFSKKDEALPSDLTRTKSLVKLRENANDGLLRIRRGMLNLGFLHRR
jgi:hypothetical protein